VALGNVAWERELFKEFKDFSNLRCNHFIKNKKIKNLLHTRAMPLPPPLLNFLNVNNGKNQ
jgi:hypothetical protein